MHKTNGMQTIKKGTNGKEFNPLYHQSVAVKKDETKEPSVVLEVYKKGYTYKDKVLRPAMVIINE